MSDSDFRPNMVGSNRSKNVYNLSIALAPHLGIPTDVIEQALIKAIEQNSVNALPSPLHNNIQETKPVDELSQSSALISPGTNQPSLLDTDSKNYTTQESSSLSYKKNRKDSLSSLIEITQNGSTSINIKLPSLHVPPPTVQGEMTNGQNSSQSSADVNTSPFENLGNRPQYYYEQNTYNGSNNENSMKNQEYIPPPQRINHAQDKFPEIQNQQIDSNFEVFKEYIPPTQRGQDKYKSYNNHNQQIGQDVSNRRQRDELQANRFQDTYNSFTPDVKSQQNNFEADFPEYFQSQQRESQSNQVPDLYNKTFSQVVSPIKNHSSETYLSEFPSLSESAKMRDSSKNSGVDLGAWGQMDLNFASVWGGKHKKWSSETETSTFEPPATSSSWNPDKEDFTWNPIQEPKPPINKKKPATFDLDDTDGWGAPPTNTIPWNDSRQGYCVDLIEEQKETVFWSVQNGNWVNVSEEYSKTVEYKSYGVNHKNRQPRSVESRKGARGVDTGATWDEIREDTRLEREQMERGSMDENMSDNIIDLSDQSNGNSTSSEIENYRPNSDTTTGPAPIVSESSRERLGNPQWKSEEEWRHDSQFKQEIECGDLINLDLNEIPESKELEEPLTITSDKEIPNEDNWSKWKDNSGSSLEEIADVKNDAWFTEDVQKRREDITDKNLLINIDSNNDNEVAESTIINTHPPIFHGSVNNEMADDLNDILFDSTNPVNTADTAKITNMDIINNELSLLSFDDDENKIPKSSVDQENDKKNNFDNLADFLKNNDYKPPRAIVEDSNELQEKTSVLPYVISSNDKEISDISHYTTPLTVSDNFSSFAPSYRSYNSSQVNVESLSSSSTIDNDRKLEHNEYRQVLNQNDQILDQYKGSVSEPQGAADPNEPNSKTATNDKEFIINLTVETPSDGRQILRLRYDDDPQIAATEFFKNPKCNLQKKFFLYYLIFLVNCKYFM
ncbi:hypothetical protein GLOIN_2v1769710 [Rhizophagus clarus]|uniref:Uncharacterized protein n=1 Tax=Rhizophagus clarus TaxID=94130 RepID=A0A8H3R4Q1_9GLOM|nr:hypothetical protein GLOIN_2v1769710 [Rhizophagus clarus]